MKPPQSSDAPRTEATAPATFAVVRHGGHQYRVTAGRRGGAGKGMAVAGLVLGLVTAGLGLIFWAVIYGEFAGSQCAYGC